MKYLEYTYNKFNLFILTLIFGFTTVNIIDYGNQLNLFSLSKINLSEYSISIFSIILHSCLWILFIISYLMYYTEKTNDMTDEDYED